MNGIKQQAPTVFLLLKAITSKPSVIEIKLRIYNPKEGDNRGVVLGLFSNDIVAVFVKSA